MIRCFIGRPASRTSNSIRLDARFFGSVNRFSSAGDHWIGPRSAMTAQRRYRNTGIARRRPPPPSGSPRPSPPRRTAPGTDGLARPRVDEAGVETAPPGERQREPIAVVGREDQMDGDWASGNRPSRRRRSAGRRVPPSPRSGKAPRSGGWGAESRYGSMQVCGDGCAIRPGPKQRTTPHPAP